MYRVVVYTTHSFPVEHGRYRFKIMAYLVAWAVELFGDYGYCRAEVRGE